MSVVVAYKYAFNPQDASVGADGQIDWSRAKPAVSEYDPVAIGLARTIAGDGEVVGVSVGTAAVASSMAKKNAISKGLDRALVVADDASAEWNATKVASALAGLVRRVDDVEVVLAGDSSIDEGARIVPAILAGHLGWPCFQDVLGVQKTADGVTVIQAVTGGTRTIDITGPAVLAATSDAVEVKAASMKDILAAGKKPLEEATADEVGVSDAAVTVTDRSRPAPQARKNDIRSSADAAGLAGELRAAGIL
ncbi:electron transfer flavoprotein beta subunit/FixA family protein [Flaviflexus salsibiostraticola]|uniref:Electron transfer flavoprotein small subunit n=1 Tax=Flaviflexus salsibiostraticola TaxID=1282737 RepID=A0A3S8Z703_9ACTO|nr:electron transfer flavoprotein beta subunit/FixA family protein [Flaviflexus salsibiostraticola]AZN29292.1 electron transfer flavoprotein beta subunit/FixA family protein [Flaviflexus salsibiostraticola]